MTLRMLTQWFLFLLNVAIFTLAISGMKANDQKKWLLAVPALYSSVEIVFYFIVLVLSLGSLGNLLSPYRSIMEAGIIAALLMAIRRGDFKWI